MAERHLLIDNDVFLLLAGAGVLERALSILGFSRERAFRLESLPYMIQKSKGIRQRYDPAHLARASGACTLIQPIVDRPSPELESQLSGHVAIDPGEVVLYGLLAERSHYLLASNDKRAMRIIATDARLTDVRCAVGRRVICLERVLRAFFDADGLDTTVRMLAPVRDCDTMLRVLFSPPNLADRNQFLAALDSYWGDLKQAVGDGFLYEG